MNELLAFDTEPNSFAEYEQMLLRHVAAPSQDLWQEAIDVNEIC